MWSNADLSRDLGKRRARLEEFTHSVDTLQKEIDDLMELCELYVQDNDISETALKELTVNTDDLEKRVESMEFERLFSNPADPNDAWLEINAGSGGTEAQDWAEMLLRMYLRWCERSNFVTEINEVSAGEVAGIKSANVRVCGDYAYGWLRTETGVHRLVRKSPFDSGNRRHTSFAAVFVSPDVDNDIEIEINNADLRIDTYRASGAGGQHVNKTDSAVRITHIPTSVVAQCQNQRSQHQNRDSAMRQLRAKLYDLQMREKNAERVAVEDSKSEIAWGSQIRSYVLDDSRIKDMRTKTETSDCGSVLDGDINLFLRSSLRAQLSN